MRSQNDSLITLSKPGFGRKIRARKQSRKQTSFVVIGMKAKTEASEMSSGVSSNNPQNNFKADKPRDELIYEFEDFRLDAAHLMLYRNDQVVGLTPKQVETLVALVERGGEVVSKEELMTRLWSDAAVEESNLSQNLYVLRKTLGTCSDGHPLIETFRRRGYRFNGKARCNDEFELVLATHTRRLTVTAEETIDSTTKDDSPKPYQRVSSKRRVTALAIIGIVAVLLITATVFYVRRSSQPREKPQLSFQAANFSQFTNSGNVVTAAISPDGKYVATALEDKGQQSLWLRQTASTANSIQLTQPAIEEVWGITFSTDSNFIYYVAWEKNKSDAELYRIPIFGGPPKKIPTYSVDTPITLSPDGNRFAYTTALMTSTGESYLKVARTDGSNSATFLKHAKPSFFAAFPGGAAWSPDGKRIAYAVGRAPDKNNQLMSVDVLDLDSQQAIPLSTRTWNSIGRVAWLGDGRAIVFSANERPDAPNQLWLVSYPGGTPTKITNDLLDYTSISASSDPGMIAAIQTQTEAAISVVPVDKPSQAKKIFKEVGSPKEKFSWTPNGRVVYASHVGGSWDLFIMDADGSNKTQLTNDPNDDLFPTISPDGRYIFFASNRSGNSNIWRIDVDGSNPVQLTRGTNEGFPECSPDGKWLVYQRGFGVDSTTIWKLSLNGGEPSQLPERFAQKSTFSRDGKLLAFISQEGEQWSLKVVSFDTGELVKNFPFPQAMSSRNFRWAPDGKSLAYVRKDDGVSHIWLQPLKDNSPRRLLDLEGANITFFDWSPDGKTIAFANSTDISDVVLITAR